MPTRRQILSASVASLAASTVSGQSRPATAPSTRPTTAPTTVPGLTADDITAAARLVGRSYTAEEIDLMRAGLDRMRTLLPRLRQREVPPGVEPAILFDPVPAQVQLPQGPSHFAPPAVEVRTDEVDSESLAFATVTELAQLMDQGKVTSVELTRLYLDRLKRHDPTLHCVVTLTEELALEQATRADAERRAGKVWGPLHGIPYGAKDLLATKGIPTTYGVSPYREQVFDVDATVIRRLEEAGAVLVAKLSLGELAMGDVWFGGTTRNPWDPEKGSSGSSAGSCSATAAGLVGFAIGSETLGSIVSPSVVCGTCGLRPTYGRVPRTGAMALSRTMDKLGPIARSAEDLAAVLSVIAGPDDQDLTCKPAPFRYDGSVQGLRIGYDKAAFDALESRGAEASKALYRQVLEKCRELFGELMPVELPQDGLASSIAGMTIGVESSESFTELTDGQRIDELVQQDAGSWPNAFRRGALTPAADYLRAQRVRRVLMQQMHEASQEVDVYVTVPQLGPGLVLTNLTGHPCCLVRAGMIEGRPRLVEFVGRLYGEADLLAVATAFERTTPQRRYWPEAFGGQVAE